MYKRKLRSAKPDLALKGPIPSYRFCEEHRRELKREIAAYEERVLNEKLLKIVRSTPRRIEALIREGDPGSLGEACIRAEGLARVWWRLESDEEARKWMRRAVDLELIDQEANLASVLGDANRAGHFFRLGRKLLLAGEEAKAQRYLESAVEARTKSIEGWELRSAIPPWSEQHQIAIYLCHLRRWKEALEWLERVTRCLGGSTSPSVFRLYRVTKAIVSGDVVTLDAVIEEERIEMEGRRQGEDDLTWAEPDIIYEFATQERERLALQPGIGGIGRAG